ncbi:AAA family ATPase [Agrobacterium rhizogenes]|uniref:AAA family ATPase n=1 Tax=Rhizobium rhizogenes TaxID=359 RepID=UPI0015746425|nr:AAA family ATPase [Rhizobium rhizogenes]NTH12273.1 AAA family ATPase [Rhizobium rhizogenes]
MAPLPKKIRVADVLSEPQPVALSNRDAKPSRAPANDDIDPDLWELDDFDPSADLRPVAEIVEGVLPESGLCGLAGQSQSGKTVVALDMAKSLVLGEKWLGKYAVPNACGVVYIPYESRENVKRRWRAIYKDTNGRTGDVPFQLVKAPPIMATRKEWEGFAGTLAVIGANFLSEHGVPLKVCFIDTLAASGMVARENEADSWAVVIDNLNRICETLNLVIVLLHHAAKSQESENIWRGSSSSYAALEVVLGVKVEKHEGEVTRRWIYTDKSKDGDTGYIADLSFEAIKVGVKTSGADMFAPVLRADTDGERKITIRKEAESKTKAEQRKKTLHDNERAFLKAIKKAMEAAGEDQPVQLSTGRWFYSASMQTVENAAHSFIPTKNFKRDFEAGMNKLLTRDWLELDDRKMRYNVTTEEPINAL